jgi:hypothetical protein
MSRLQWNARVFALALLTASCTALMLVPAAAPAEDFQGTFYSGQGDAEYLQMLDVSRRMFAADPEYQNFPMLYTPAWNGFVEGPTWGAWWIQNSYGPTYCGLPVFQEPLVTFLQNAQDLWFDQMGDGKRTWKWRADGPALVIPDGQLCDAAAPGWIIPKQGDGNVAIHDWGMEFTAAGVVMQAELLLIGRDEAAIRRYLPRLERCADFIESRRDPKNNLFLAGAAGNLLAPSYAGWKKPDGTYDKAYLAGLSINYIAGLDRLIELEKLAGRAEKVKLYTERRELARKGLPALATDEGYFIKYLDPDGTRHGVYGAAKHGYFEAVCNHDAVCFRVADDAQAERIVQKMLSIPGLRPHGLIVTNCPGLDDMYTKPDNWLWKFGTWVNGGHWTTCEARMVMAYYRQGRYEDARRSMRQLMKFARDFRMDNPLVDFGGAVYQPREPVNLCYDSFGSPAAMVRGLFEYLYGAEGLTLVPHVPPGITRLEQHFPIRFGRKKLFLATAGSGPVTAVTVNGQPWTAFDAKSVTLPYDKTPDMAVVQIALGGAKPGAFAPRTAPAPLPDLPDLAKMAWSPKRFPVIAANELPLRIGADSRGGSRFLGDVARAQVFGRALSPGEIGQLASGKGEKLDKDPALVGDWRFDARKGNAFPNAAGEDLPALIVGDVASVDSPHGNAVRLDGRGYLEVKNAPKLNLTTGCTMAAWICPKKQDPMGGRIIDRSEAGTSNGYLLDTCPGNSLRLIVERGSPGCDAKLVPDRWVHVAATADSEGGLAIYVDGKQVVGTRQELPVDVVAIAGRVGKLRKLCDRLAAAGLADCYEAAHARLAVEYLAVTLQRLAMIDQGKIRPLPPVSQYAADKSYFATTARLCEGLEKTIQSYKGSPDEHKKRVYKLMMNDE